jgi:hypothetical protein
MKKIIYIITGILLLTLFPACEKWLDVNENPSSASNTAPSPDLLLRAIQTNFVDAYESGGTRASWITQNVTKTNANNTNDYIQRWNAQLASATWAYQAWFVFCASNLQPMIDKATTEEAWHYVGAAHLIHAWGFMLMIDLYGEMPYAEALGDVMIPKFDDGKTIFYGCLDKLETAIEYLSRSQPVAATPLASGDVWNGGDAQKWIKLAYGLKARWLNNLSKKGDGAYAAGKYDIAAIEEALTKAPQSVNDNTVMKAINSSSSDRAGVQSSLQFQNVGSTTTRLTKWYTDLLTNTFTGGSGVLDPRAERIIPSGEFYNPGTGEKEWVMSQGADIINTNIRTNGNGPAQFEIRATIPAAAAGTTTNHPSGLLAAASTITRNASSYTNRWYSTNTNAARQGDSVYVSCYSDRLDWILNFSDNTNDRYLANRYNGILETNPGFNDDVINITSTGSFYIRADAPAHLVCAHEMYFIKAEALLRKGDAGGALIAYKAGIRTHMEAMNERLAGYPQVLGKEVISGAEIDAFLTSAAVAQTAGELTMAKIMQQKQIAMSFTVQNWNDLRRFNYSVPDPQFGVVYPDFGRPFEFDAAAQECYPSTNPNDVRYWPRRFQQCTHEQTYNETNWLESHPEAKLRSILSAPVWWDSPTDDYK